MGFRKGCGYYRRQTRGENNAAIIVFSLLAIAPLFGSFPALAALTLPGFGLVVLAAICSR
jgi:hypothetical protein